MSPHPLQSRVAQAFRRARSRLRGRHAVALSAVAVVAFGLAGLRAVDLPGPRPVTADGRLRIEVVHPVEPEIVPGSVMEVGELVDGFEGLPPPLPPLTDVLWSHDEDWEDWDRRYASARTADRRGREAPAWYARSGAPERASPVRAVQRWFGFDAPRPDFEAERAARRARFEAMERRARERQDRERRRHARAERDRYAREGWRPVPREAVRWREAARPPDAPRDAWREEEVRPDAPRPGLDDGPRPYQPRDAVLTVPDSMVGFRE